MNENNRNRKLISMIDGISQPLVAVLIALFTGAIVILLCGSNPLAAYGTMISHAFGNVSYLSMTFKRATPIIMGGLAVCVAWRSGFESMGGEGQMIFGAFLGALVAYYMPAPGIVRLICALIVACIAGALYSILSGWLFDRFKVSFLISTLMLNYIANYICGYFTNFVVNDPETLDRNAVQTGKIAADAQLGSIGKWLKGIFEKMGIETSLQKFDVHWGFLLAIICVIACYIVFKKTSFGYKSRVSGLNPNFALYGGINSRRMLYIVMIISGVLAGLGGCFEALGAKYRYVDQMIFTTGYAWSGMVAALLANMNPIGTAVASTLLAGLAIGGSSMQTMGVPVEVCNMIQGIIMLLMSVRLIRITTLNMKRRSNAKGGEHA